MYAVGQLTRLTQLKQYHIKNNGLMTNAEPGTSELDVQLLSALGSPSMQLQWSVDLPFKTGCMKAMLQGMPSLSKLELRLCKGLPTGLVWPAILTHVHVVGEGVGGC